MISEQRYTIRQEYMKTLDFSSPASPEFFISSYQGKSTLSTSIDIEIQSDENNGLFCINLMVQCSVNLEDGRTVINVSTEYCALVIINKLLDDIELKKLLTIEIPQAMYPHVALLVRTTTTFSGYNPIELPNYSFSENKSSEDENANKNGQINDRFEETDCIRFEDECESILTLKRLLVEVESEKHGKEFLDMLKNRGGEISTFNDFTLNRTLFRFLPYVDYNTASELDEDQYAKRLMFFLIVASNNCEWHIVKKIGGRTELFYKYDGEEDEKKISDLSTEEFIFLASCLIVNVLTELHVNIFLIELEYGAFDELINPVPSQDEYRDAFHYYVLSEEQQMFVDTQYDKISKTRLEAFTSEL